MYGNTLGHDFALDDTIVISSNQFTKQGLAGIDDHLTNAHFTGFYGQEKNLVAGGRYRPLSLIIFSIQYEFFGLNPSMGHLFNILFYVLNAFLIYLVLRKLLKHNNFNKGIPFALLASLLWFFHPIHTEAVANIKGLDEILCFCFSLLALYFSLKFFDQGKKTNLLFIFISFILALLSKENAITWLVIIPLSLYFFRKLNRKSISIVLSLLAASGVWFLMRENAIGDKNIFDNVADNIMNDPFLYASISEKYASIVYTMGKYIQLLIFPHPLTFDYYPKHIPIVNWGHPLVILSLLLLLGMTVIAFWGIRKKRIISYSIWFYAISLSVASNILFPVGVFMNERFVYVSSLAFCIALTLFINWLLQQNSRTKKVEKIAYSLLLIVFLLYGVKTFSRNLVWKNNYTLSTNDANISVNGAKSNVMAGGTSLERAQEESNPQIKQKLLNESIFYLNRALSIYPEYIDALLLMGNAQWAASNNAYNAMKYYREILAMNPNHANAWQNIHIVLSKDDNKNRVIDIYENLLQDYPNNARSYIELGRLYGQYRNNLPKAIETLEKGRSFAPSNFQILSNLGTAYGMAKDFGKAIEVLEQAAEIKPQHAKTQADLGLSYYFSGQMQKAKAAFDRAVQLNPSFDRSAFPI